MTLRGRVIKSGELRRGNVPAFNPDDAARTIQEQVDQANSDLKRERDKATSEVQQVFDKATEEGFRKGYERGLKQGLDEQEAAYKSRLIEDVSGRTKPALDLLAKLGEELSSQPTQWIAKWETEAMELITAIASRVSRKVVAGDDQTIMRTLREVLSMVARSPRSTIHVHPTDLETIQLHEENWKSTIGKLGTIEFIANPEITPGGCRLQTDHCSIDATIETQINRLIDEIAVSADMTAEPELPPAEPPTP